MADVHKSHKTCYLLQAQGVHANAHAHPTCTAHMHMHTCTSPHARARKHMPAQAHMQTLILQQQPGPCDRAPYRSQETRHRTRAPPGHPCCCPWGRAASQRMTHPAPSPTAATETEEVREKKRGGRGHIRLAGRHLGQKTFKSNSALLAPCCTTGAKNNAGIQLA
jgi:hypothetical protein